MSNWLRYVTFSSPNSMNLYHNLFDFDREETAGEVIFFRLFELFVGYFTIRLAWDWGHYITRISDVVLPLGIANYIDVSFMFGNSLPLVNAGLIAALVVVGFFRWSRYAYLGAFLLLHVQFATRFTLGEIPHSSNVLGMTLLGLALALVFFDDGRFRRRFTMGFTYFFLGLGYTLAAFCKLIGTGITWPDGRHLWMWINEKTIDATAKTGVIEYNWLQELALSDYWVATAMLAGSLIAELCAVLMWWKQFRTPMVLVVIGLHLGIFYIMNIMFMITLLELILLALPWAVWIERMLPTPAVRTLHKLSQRGRIGYA